MATSPSPQSPAGPLDNPIAMRSRALVILSVCLALLYGLGLFVDWPGWLRGGVAWEWVRQSPAYLSTRFLPLAGLIIAWLLLLFFAMRPRHQWTRWQTALLLLAATILTLLAPIVIASQHRSQPLSIAFLRTVHPTAGFFEEGLKINDPQEFIQQHVSRMTGYRGVHLRTQPPGWPVAFWLMGQGWEHFPGAADAVAHRLKRADCTAHDLQGILPAQISAATLQMSILLISALGVLPLYSLARDEFSSYVARITAVVYALLPGLLVFQAHFDVLYAVWALFALWLSRRAYVDGRGWAMILLALLIAGSTFFAFGPLIFVVFINAYLLIYAWLWRRSRQAIRPIIIINVVIVAAIAVTWLVFWLLWRVSWPEMLMKGLEIHDSVRGTQPLWPLFNLYDLAVFSGIPLFLWAIAAGVVAAMRMNRPRSGDALILGWLASVIVLNLSGSVRAEAGRLWLFLMPVGLIIAVAFLVETLLRLPGVIPVRGAGGSGPTTATNQSALFVLVLVAFGIQALITGLYLSNPLPADAAPEAIWSVPDYAEPIYYEVGGTIALSGYTVEEGRGDDLIVTLYWQALSRTQADYSVFVHVVGQDGEPVAQSDGVPMAGALPTWCWVGGEVVADAHVLPGAAAMEGPLRLSAGIYDWRTGERIPVTPVVPDNVIPLR